MNKSCDYQGTAHDCYEFTGAAKRTEECTVEAEATIECRLESMVFFQVLPDTFTNEAAKHQPQNNAGLRIRPLTFLPKIQNKAAEASPFRNSYHQAFLISREMLVRGCIKLAGVIRRTAAVCFSPSTSADEDDLPYSQLDKVGHALRREAFGPLYLVT